MAVLAVQKIPVDGLAPTFVAADAAGDQSPVAAGTVAHVKNGSAASITVTFSVPVAVGGAVSIAKTVAAGGELFMPLGVRTQRGHGGRAIAQGTGQNATWTYSAATSVTVAVVKTP